MFILLLHHAFFCRGRASRSTGIPSLSNVPYGVVSLKMSVASSSDDAWSLAKTRMLNDVTLSDEERRMLETSTLHDVVGEVQSLDDQHANQSKSRRVMACLDPLLKTLEKYGPALNVFTQGEHCTGFCVSST